MNTIFILENEFLGTWWVGKSIVKTDTDGFPIHRSVTQDQLNDNLFKKYNQYSNPQLHLFYLNKTKRVCYGIERWLSQLDQKIKTKPELKKLLTAGWDMYDTTGYSSIYVLTVNSNEINQIYDNLKRYWGFPSNTSFKLRSPYTLKKSLNISGKTRKEKYELNKRDPTFIIKKKCANLEYRLRNSLKN
jgi:hypothetical protein